MRYPTPPETSSSHLSATGRLQPLETITLLDYPDTLYSEPTPEPVVSVAALSKNKSRRLLTEEVTPIPAEALFIAEASPEKAVDAVDTVDTVDTVETKSTDTDAPDKDLSDTDSANASPYLRPQDAKAPLFTAHTQRMPAVWRFQATSALFPKKISITPIGIQTELVKSLFFPWVKEEEHIPFKRVASVRHLKGLFSDALVVESIGGSNDLNITGLDKRDAATLVGYINHHLA